MNELAERYERILLNPVTKEALRGDLTAMLAYTKQLYSYQTTGVDLHQQLRDRIGGMKGNELRKELNIEMLKNDVKKHNFLPDRGLISRGFLTDVKEDLFLVSIPSIT